MTSTPGEIRPSGRGLGRLGGVFVAGWLLAAGALAQPLTLRNARVLVGDGTEHAQAAITIAAGKIGAVTTGEGPQRGKSLDLSGKVVTPGLIDLWSTVGVEAGGSGRAAAQATDLFNSYDEDALRMALRQGITSGYVPALTSNGTGGVGAVVRFLPGGERDDVIVLERAALSANIGRLSEAGPIERVQAAERLRNDFNAALDYREALETYEEELKEYEESIQKNPRELSEKKEGGETKPAEVKPAAGEERRPRRRPRGGSDFLAEQGLFDEAEAAKEEKKDEGPKKPEKPAANADYDVLLEAIDGKLPWRVAAHRPEDVLNALDVAREFNLALVIEGGAGAWRYGERLKEQRAAVVLDGQVASLAFMGGGQRDRNDCGLAALTQAGVDVYVASGPRPASGDVPLSLLAARAVQQGLPEDRALAMLTGEAAKLLGVSDKLGRIDGGLAADLVVWSDHPFAPGARVERVFIAGREVYTAEGVTP